MQPVPFLLVGDSPRAPSGLGRIARDLGRLFSSLPELDFCQLGWEGPEADPLIRPAWAYVPFQDPDEDWGAGQAAALYSRLWGDRLGVVMTVWDPARAFTYLRMKGGPAQLWGYFAVDGHQAGGGFNGPAADAVRQYDRVLAYGRYGAGVLRQVAPDHGAIPYLPHGLDLSQWQGPTQVQIEDQVDRWFTRARGPVLGCVATNQPRKDLHLFFATVKALRDQGRKVFGWLHTDRLHTQAWSVPQMVDHFGLQRHVVVTQPTDVPDDRWLEAAYRRCATTLHVGRGEGFGYPVVESLACGVPPVVIDYAGAPELVYEPRWRVEPDWYRPEGPYLIERPQVDPLDMAQAVARVLNERDEGRAARCRLSVAHLDWTVLAPRWVAWVRKGLERELYT